MLKGDTFLMLSFRFSLSFFFSSRRRHTRLVSDWSSDVCSSHLAFSARCSPRGASGAERALAGRQVGQPKSADKSAHRSEERRVGKEGRAGGVRDHQINSTMRLWEVHMFEMLSPEVVAEQPGQAF